MANAGRARRGRQSLYPLHMKLLPVKPTINFEDLEKIDIRVGEIEKVEDVVGSNKLVRLTVDFGDFKRNILVGLKQERENSREIISCN